MIVLADVFHVSYHKNTDIYSEPCYGDHTAERQDSYGRWITYNLTCTCDVVPVGIVNGRARFAVSSSGTNLDDLPF